MGWAGGPKKDLAGLQNAGTQKDESSACRDDNREQGSWRGRSRNSQRPGGWPWQWLEPPGQLSELSQQLSGQLSERVPARVPEFVPEPVPQQREGEAVPRQVHSRVRPEIRRLQVLEDTMVSILVCEW